MDSSAGRESAKRLCLSLEPPAITTPASAGDDADLFARPAKLLDVSLEDGHETFTRDGPEKSIGERLSRIWAERGDFSALTAASIKAAATEDKGKVEEKEEDSDRLSPQDMRQLQTELMSQLEVARGELTTALDLLSVLSPLTDPPTIDPESLPLPPQSLTIVPTRPPAPLDADPPTNPLATFPIATSLASLRASANSFLTAAQDLSKSPDAPTSSTAMPTPRTPRKAAVDPWPTLLHLRSSTAYTLIPLGAMRGATLTGRNDVRAARQVGIFYGCTEAREQYRRGAIARVVDLVGDDPPTTGRTLVVTVSMDGEEDKVAWVPPEGTEAGGVESVLRARGRSAFAEEIFGALSAEARADSSLKARLILGKRTVGDSIVTEGHGWTLTVTMVHIPASTLPNTTPEKATIPSVASSLLPLLRLLYLQEYALRRAPPATLLWTRPILQTLSVLLSHTHRRRALQAVISTVQSEVQASGLAVDVEYWGSSMVRRPAEESDLGESVVRTLRGDKELGGLVVFRVAHTRVFHISYSLLLPQAPSTASMSHAVTHQTLALQAPGTALPIAIPSLAHLQLFLDEHVSMIKKGKEGKGKGKAVAANIKTEDA